MVLEVDVMDEAAVGRAFEQLRGLTLDVVVNNAGIGGGQPLETTDTQSWRRIIDTNVWGTFLVSRQALPLMREGGRVIMFLASPGASAITGQTYNICGGQVMS